MIHDRTIICIANRWDYDPTSKHHVMKVLARTNQVVWVNYRGSRRPRPCRRDLSAAWHTLRAVWRGAARVADSVVQLTPLVIPGAGGALAGFSQRLLVSQIQRLLRHLPQRPVQLWTFAPDVAYLAGQFGEERLVYYCVDEFGAFEDHDGQAIRRAEQRLLGCADVVITTSQKLYESRSTRHPNTHLVRHGVDYDHFAAAVSDRPLDRPADLADIRRPIFGFFGLVHHWFDVELLAAVARSRPDHSFVLIGDVHADVGVLQGLSNVYLLGRRDYRLLPAYCAAFDAALLPFRINEMTRNINPIKLREYLAAGLPVVSTALPEAAAYQPDVLIAHGAEQFARCGDRALGLASAEARHRRSARVAHESWNAVVERLAAIVARGKGCQDGLAGTARGMLAENNPDTLFAVTAIP